MYGGFFLTASTVPELYMIDRVINLASMGGAEGREGEMPSLTVSLDRFVCVGTCSVLDIIDKTSLRFLVLCLALKSFISRFWDVCVPLLCHV